MPSQASSHLYRYKMECQTNWIRPIKATKTDSYYLIIHFIVFLRALTFQIYAKSQKSKKNVFYLKFLSRRIPYGIAFNNAASKIKALVILFSRQGTRIFTSQLNSIALIDITAY